MLAEMLSRYWWLTLARGVVWILFGIMTFLRPGLSLVMITLMFGISALVDGVAHIVNAYARRGDSENWWLLLLSGIAGVGIGVLTLLNPGLTALALLFYIAVWAIATGLLQLVAAIQLRKEITGELWLAVSGLLSVTFGVFLMARPGAGVLSLVWVIGAYAIAAGCVLVVLAFVVRSFGHRISNRLAGSAR